MVQKSAGHRGNGSFYHDLHGFKNIPGGCLGFLNHQQYVEEFFRPNKFQQQPYPLGNGYISHLWEKENHRLKSAFLGGGMLILRRAICFINLIRCLVPGKNETYSPIGGSTVVIYDGRIRKKSPTKL